jgi:L-threonylcarbamoyladenylate synthase
MTHPSVHRATQILRQGGLVAFPTETVYGLGADAMNADAVGLIFAAKGRPPAHPLTVHLGPSVDPRAWGVWDAEAQQLAARYWPGPLTLVVPRLARVPNVVTGGRDTVGLRVPAHPLAIELLESFGGGVAAPSANQYGGVSPTRAEHVVAELGDRVHLVLDGGACPLGLESTVLSLVPPTPLILRRGAVSQAELEATLGVAIACLPPEPGGGALRSRLEVVADVERALEGRSGRVAVLSRHRPSAPEGVQLDWERAPADPAEYARGMYDRLRDLDARHHQVLLVEAVPQGGLWDAVRDRLRHLSGRT